MSEETTNQVQTEATNLSVVEETVLGSIAELPATGWYNLQPNSYGDFGAKYKKMPRSPISRNQQLRKGMLVGEDSGIPFETDITKDVIDRFAAGIYRCNPIHNGSSEVSQFAVSAVTSTGFTVAADGDLLIRSLVVARGFDTSDNDGLFLVASGSTSTEIKAAGLTAETSPPDNAIVDVAGYRGATGTLQLDSDGNLISVAGVDFTDLNLAVGQWIVVGGDDRGTNSPYTFADPLYRGAAKIADISTTKLTLERRSWVVEKNSYLDLATVCAGNIDTVIEAIDRGPGGDSITIQIVADAGAPAGSVTEVSNAVTIHVKTSATATTVGEFEALVNSSTLIRVKTVDSTPLDAVLAGDVIAATSLDHGDEGTDTGAGQEIEIYFTKWYRNLPINHDDYAKPSYAFEVEYPELDDGTEYEYLFGNVIDEAVWNLGAESKATLSLTFVGTRTLNPTETRKDGPEDALDPVCQEGVSTSTDLQRLRMVDVDEVGIGTDFESLKITNKNNVAGQKQLGALGARRHNHGEHMVSVDAEVIFTTTEIITAVRDNRAAAMDILIRNPDFGALIDVQSMTLDSAGKKLEKNKGVTIASKATGFQTGISTNSLTVFAYLPPIPEEDQ